MVLTVLSLVLVFFGLFWPRFEGARVYDVVFDSGHEVESYFNDETNRDVMSSWLRRDLNELFLMQAASWEALEVDREGAITITTSRESCFT